MRYPLAATTVLASAPAHKAWAQMLGMLSAQLLEMFHSRDARTEGS